MRNLFLTIFFCLSLVSFSQQTVSLGNFTKFPDDKMYGSYYKPSLAFGQVGSSYVLSLKVVQPDMYARFDETSRILVKFEDDYVIKLPILYSSLGVSKNYDNSIVGKTIVHHYITYTSYELCKEFIDRIVNKEEKIKKIRIVFANGDATDYDINKKYMKKLTTGLKESYYRVVAKQQQKQKTLNDEDF